MKCLCGYEKVNDWRLEGRLKDEPNFKNGGEDFKSSQHSIRFEMSEPNYQYDGVEDKYLYACPKCGTIKID